MIVMAVTVAVIVVAMPVTMIAMAAVTIVMAVTVIVIVVFVVVMTVIVVAMRFIMAAMSVAMAMAVVMAMVLVTVIVVVMTVIVAAMVVVAAVTVIGNRRQRLVGVTVRRHEQRRHQGVVVFRLFFLVTGDGAIGRSRGAREQRAAGGDHDADKAGHGHGVIGIELQHGVGAGDASRRSAVHRRHKAGAEQA